MLACARRKVFFMDRREVQRQAAMKAVFDSAKDEYCVRNHLGQFVCRLCSTPCKDEATYYVHTQAKRHSTNLARIRKARELAEEATAQLNNQTSLDAAQAPRRAPRVGKPNITHRIEPNPESNECAIRFELDYPLIEDGTKPLHRFMSTYEQTKEPRDDTIMYLLFAAEPYETVAFKLPNQRLDRSEDKYSVKWDPLRKRYYLLLTLS
jgi:splicing factor 3A subunit 2